MAISIDWGTRIIHIPRNYLALLQSNPVEVRQLDMDVLRLTLKALEETSEGMSFESSHEHTAPITVGGVQLARVVEILNGYTVTFEDGQYAVNVVGANTNLADVTNVNQVSVRSSNSAGLVNSDELKIQSFQDARVWINTHTGLAGVVFSRGTPANPVDNPTDAREIANTNNLERFHLSGEITLPNGEEFAGSDWKGHSIISSKINLNNVSAQGAYFNNLELSGHCNGYIDVENSKVQTITNFSGILQDCSIDNIQLDAANTEIITAINCRSHSANMSVLDINSANCPLVVKDYFGGLQITNLTAGNSLNIDMSSGEVHITSSCTSGTILLRGVFDILDESGPGCTVVIKGKVITSSDEVVITDSSADKIWNKVLS